MRFVGEVRDDGGDVTRPFQSEKCRAALEVDQNEIEDVRGWAAIMPSTNVRKNSDLPEPVAPTHSPCGPMPFRPPP